MSLGVRVPETETRRSDPSRPATKDAPDAGGAILSEKMAKGRSGSSEDGSIPWTILSRLLLALLFTNGSTRMDEYFLDGTLFLHHLC